MFKKVLIAEDMDSINQAVAATLSEMGIKNIAHAQYCDQAWLMIKKALQDEEPFDLLICDLSFKKDHRNEKILSGKELINILKSEASHLKIIVNTIEDHPQTVRELWDSGNINAYVCKDRQGLRYLKEAVECVGTGNAYNSPNIEKVLQQNNLLVLDEFEMNILNLLSEGRTQDEIQDELRKKQIRPSSKSAIEKKLKEMKEIFEAKTTVHLISIVKDLKLI